MPELLPPVTFRREILEPVIDLLRMGESCALVGVGSSGKSNIARHLPRADVRLTYFENRAPHIFVVYVNCKPLAHHPPQALYLQALDQLTRMAEELASVYQPLLPVLTELWQAAQASPEALAKRNFDRAIDHVVRAGAELIVVELDDCDDLFGKAPPVLFADLRELRDNHKRQVVYLTLTRREPAFLRLNTPEFEELFELISATGHTIAITPYLEADAIFMLQRLASRQETAPLLAYSEKRRIYELSGGHAGLIRSIYFAVRRNPDSLENMTPAQLLTNADIEDECSKILHSLEDEERAELRRLVTQAAPTTDGLARLKRRGLILSPTFSTPQIFAPVFDVYLRQQFGPAREAVTIEFVGTARQVRVNGQLISSLNWPEFEILRHLYHHRPDLCRINELFETMRPAELGRPHDRAQGNPVERLAQYVLQIRTKLGKAAEAIQREQDGYRFVSH
jgi:hypothetical protein